MYDNGTFYELDYLEVMERPDEWDWHEDRKLDGTFEYTYCSNADWSINGDDPQNDWGTIMGDEGKYLVWNTSIQNMMCYGETEFEETPVGLEAAMKHIEESIDKTPKH